ncbi:MAG TPA: YetF domain-containing protein [Alphaproteobacteria bacterium]|nr:YetF domain-containing protein [Alphaproteobacteria bacterium]
MEPILRSLALYVALLVFMRIAGRRTLGEMTPFDLVLTLIVSEATQQALIGEDNSLVTALLVIGTLLGADIVMSLVRTRWPKVETMVEGAPLVVFADGAPIEEVMRRLRIGVDDILAAARSTQGLERLDQIKYAVMETGGSISIIPKSKD